MSTLEYFSHNTTIRLTATTQARATAPGAAAAGRSVFSAHAAMRAQAGRFGALFAEIPARESETTVVLQPNPAVTILPTETVTVEGLTKADLKVMRDRYGLEVVREGLFGKVLLKVKDAGGPEAVAAAFDAARKIYRSGKADAAHPNFVRLVGHTRRKPAAAGAAAAAPTPWWNHLNDGGVGVRGADAALRAAWTIHRGDSDVRVAVLDEGVDVGHPDLAAAVVAQKDAVDGNPTAAPDGDDAHGTACAGIVLGRGAGFPGASACSLVAVRIAKGDGHGNWVFDDFDTADAVDWAWKEGKADVLSNSWGGGAPVDAITNALARARTKGRGGKGCVVAVAAGNSHGPVQYPATLPDVLAVGASNEWDEHKSPGSRDGETWWGSCFGPELSLVAPGVHIATTDIAGAKGYAGGDHTLGFNGTSSATPHVAAAAALILSVAPKLTEKQVRDILTGEATRLLPSGKLDPARKWNKHMGWGRLDAHAALRRALHP